MVKRHYGIVTEEYKLAHFYYDIDEWELYDRFADPMEMINVYHDTAYTKIIEKLKLQLVDLRVQYKDSPDLDMYYINNFFDE